MKFTYYTIIGRDLELLKGHIDNVKKYITSTYGETYISQTLDMLVVSLKEEIKETKS